MIANHRSANRTRGALVPALAFALASALAAALALGGCSAPPTMAPPPPPVSPAGLPPEPALPATSAALPTTAAAAPATVAPVAQASAKVYFVRDEYLSLGAARKVPATTPAKAAMLQLLAGPSTAEKSWDLHTEIPTGTKLRSLSIAGGIATVDLTKRFTSGGGTLTMTLRIAQVVNTLTQFSGVTRVAFRIDGKHVESIGGEGLMVSPPVSRADFVDSLPSIMLEDPVPGARVESPIRLRGSADVFEGRFTARVTDAAGRIVTEQPIQASSGTGTRGSFDALVPFSATRHGDGWITVFEPSAEDGSPTNVLRIRVVL